MEETLRVLVALAITVFLVILRFEAEDFGAAEYDEATRDGQHASLTRRLSWIVLGFVLVGALLIVHPDAPGDLGIALGDRGAALLLGFGFGALGMLQAVAYAFFRYAADPPPRPGPTRAPCSMRSRRRSSTRRRSAAPCWGCSCSSGSTRARPS